MLPLSTATFLLLLFVNFRISDGAFAAMSVDFGSQNLKLGLVKPGVPLEIVLNKESQRKTANLIAFHNGERLFGETALQMSYKNPERVFPFVTDLLGKKFDNPVVQEYIKRYPYLNITADPERETVVFNTNDASYSVETLVGMILWNAREQVVVYGKTPIKDVVLTVPAYFNQAEREAVVRAAEIAGLNPLQLMSDGASAAVNYAFTRRKDIAEKAQYLLIYDIGASKTVASVIELKLAKENNSKVLDPVVNVIGVGYNRNLGGHVLTTRIRDYLIAEFVKTHKTKEPIYGNLRAMAKLLKEAERVKHVLSANTQTYAQIESVFEDKDFRHLMTRDILNDILKEIEMEYLTPVADALRMAELNVENIDQVILFGAGTRIPRLQDLLKEYFKGKEPNRFLNTDEASALGALYQAAHLSKGFKVKKIIVHELQLYPIQINFETTSDNSEKTLRRVDRTIFAYKSFYPTNRKIMTFTSHQDDFTVNLHYGNLEHLSKLQLEEFGATNITDVEIKGVTEAFKSAQDEGHVFKGIKAFFAIDYFGIVRSDGAEAIIEQKPVKKNSTLESIVESIGNLFGSKEPEPSEGLKDDSSAATPPESQSSENDDNEKKDETTSTENEQKKETETKEEEKAKDSETKKESDTTSNATLNATEIGGKNETKPEKPKIVKTKLAISLYKAQPDLDKDQVDESKKVLLTFEKAERSKAEREAAHNELEARVYDLRVHLEDEEFTKFSRNNELENLTQLIQEAAQWLEDDVDMNTKTEEFITKRAPIDEIVTEIKQRKRDYEERPKLIEFYMESFKNLTSFIEKVKNESILDEKAFKKPDEVVKDNEEFIKTRLPKGKVDDKDDTFNVEAKVKIEKVVKTFNDLVGKVTRKLKEIEKAAKKAAEDAAKAANATKNATTDESETAADAKPEENEKVVENEEVEIPIEGIKTDDEGIETEEKKEDKHKTHDEV